VTGLGIVSCLGNDKNQVTDALKTGRSGISATPEYAEIGMRSQISGTPEIDFKDHIDRKQLRFMGSSAAYAYISMQQAVEDAGLTEGMVSNVRTGIIAGSGGASSASQVEAADIMRDKGVRRVGPYRVTQTMGSTVSACLATPFGIKGVNYSMSSACSGGGEEEHWTMSCLFDAMGALSSKYNDTPTEASRAYDAERDGFVIAGGGGMLVVEELEHALARGANIYAEVVGYGATSDGADMVAPSGEGAVRCMQLAMQGFNGGLDSGIDYLNAHGTSTPAGDVTELRAVSEAFDGKTPKISSTKSLSGHSLGAAGVQEAIYCLLMQQGNFITASANINTLDPEAGDVDIVRETITDAKLDTVMSNSFGFGGTNASLVMQRYNS